MSFAAFLHRAVAWLTRNPEARANALELAAIANRARASERERQGRAAAASQLRERAAVFERRARQLRPAIGPVRNTVPIPPPPKRGQG